MDATEERSPQGTARRVSVDPSCYEGEATDRVLPSVAVGDEAGDRSIAIRSRRSGGSRGGSRVRVPMPQVRQRGALSVLSKPRLLEIADDLALGLAGRLLKPEVVDARIRKQDGGRTWHLDDKYGGWFVPGTTFSGPFSRRISYNTTIRAFENGRWQAERC